MVLKMHWKIELETCIYKEYLDQFSNISRVTKYMLLMVIFFCSLSVFKMLTNLNLSQDSEHHSFGLFMICAAVTGFLYSPKLRMVGSVPSYLIISGDGYSTGKSLMFDACMMMLYGKRLDCTAPTTVPKLFDMLSQGSPIYGKARSKGCLNKKNLMGPTLF